MNATDPSNQKYFSVNPFRFLDKYFAGMGRMQVFLIGIAVIAVFGVADYATGFEISFSFFYLFPILIVTWYYNLKAGMILIVLSIAMWTITNAWAGEAYSWEPIRFWNAGIRAIFFTLVAVLSADLKAALDKLTRISRTDPLTFAYNSREFRRLADLEIERARRYQHPMTLAFLDLDNFKQVNDQFGHMIGDRLLQSVALTISLGLRTNDILCRIGGDEFVILLPEADRSAAEIVLHKIQRMVRDDLHDKEWRTTLSIGAVVYDSPPHKLDEILRQADVVMYRVKTSTKNQTLILDGSDVSLKS
jgi:diguanylate cyclase (GGDEF)-like protein